MSDTPPTVTVYQGGRHILASGGSVVTYGAAPLIVAVGSDVLVVSLDLYLPLQRPDGSTVGGRSGPNSVAPGAPLTHEIGGCTVSVALHPVDAGERSVQPPSFAGRVGPTSWHLTWEVWKDAPGMMMPASPEPDWRLPEITPREIEVSDPWETPAHWLNPVVPS